MKICFVSGLCGQLQGDEDNELATSEAAAGREWAAMGKDDVLRQTEARVPYGKQSEDCVRWKVTPAGREADLGNAPDTTANPLPEGFMDEWSVSEDAVRENFFKHVFPPVEGHAAKMGKYLSSTKASYNGTYSGRKIKFHDPDAEDPDYMVKHCYTLLVAGAAERQKGTANLWKQGAGPGRTSYPDFGKYADQKLFECFVSAAPYMFCDEKHWYAGKEAATWEIFRPVLGGLDVKRAAIFKGIMSFLLDESIVAGGRRMVVCPTTHTKSVTHGVIL
jgi:hypothetical protein